VRGGGADPWVVPGIVADHLGLDVSTPSSGSSTHAPASHATSRAVGWLTDRDKVCAMIAINAWKLFSCRRA